MQAIILVGGLGTRLRSVVNDKPKPMAEIVNKPFVEYLLDSLRDNGVSDIIFAVGYKGDIIESYFGDGHKWGLNIEYAYEKELMGTAGALKNAYPLVKGERILVLNGDTYYEIDYKSFIDYGQNNDLDMLIVLRKVEDVSRYGKVVMKGERILKFNEKQECSEPGIINGGIYLIKTSLLQTIPEGKISLENTMIPRWLTEGKRLGGIINKQYFIDIGVPRDYFKFIEDIKERNEKYKEEIVRNLEVLINADEKSSEMNSEKLMEKVLSYISNVYGMNSKKYEKFLGCNWQNSEISGDIINEL